MAVTARVRVRINNCRFEKVVVFPINPITLTDIRLKVGDIYWCFVIDKENVIFEEGKGLLILLHSRLEGEAAKFLTDSAWIQVPNHLC